MADFEVTGEASIDPDKIVEDVDAIIDKLDELEETIARIDTAIDELSNKEIDISVLIDGQDKLDELRLFLEDLEAKDYTAKILIDIQNKDELDELFLEVMALSLEDHKVDVTADTSTIDDATSKLKSLDSELSNNKKALDDSKNSADGFGFSLGMLAPLAIPAAAGIMSLTGGALGLASAFGTMLPPIALVGYATDKLYTSISTLYSGLTASTQAALLNSNSMQQSIDILDNNSTAFKAMSKSAQDAALGYIFLKQQLTDFQNEIQPEAASILTNGMNLLAQAIGSLTPAAVGAGEAISETLDDLSSRLSDPTFTKFFADMASNVQLLVSDWGNGVVNIIEGVAALLDAFMPLAVDISGGFDSMTEKFDTWAQKLSTSEGFKKFVATVETDGPLILNILGQLASFIAKVVGALGEESGNTGFLKFLDNALKDLNKFSGTHEGVLQVVGAIGLFGLSLSKLGPLLGPLTTFLATPVGAIVGVIVALGAAFLYAYTTSKTFHDWVNANIVPQLSQLGGDVTQMKKFFIQIWPQIQEVWQKYGQNILNIVTNDLKTIVGIVGGLMTMLEGIIQIALGLLTGNWSEVWQGIIKLGQGFWKALSSLFMGMLNDMVQHAEIQWKFMSGLWDSAWRGIKGTFNTNLRDIEIYFGQMTSEVIGDAERFGSNLVNAIVSAIASVVRWFQSLPGRIISALGNLGNLLVNAGENIIIGLINGISNEIGNLEGYLNDITSWITSWKGPPEKDKTLLQGAGESIMQGLINGMESKYDAVHASLSGFTNSIGQNFSKQLNTNIAARINAAVNTSSSGVGGALGGQGNIPGVAGSNSVNIASGAITINNPVAEPSSQTLARTLTTISKFGILQAPAGVGI